MRLIFWSSTRHAAYLLNSKVQSQKGFKRLATRTHGTTTHAGSHDGSPPAPLPTRSVTHSALVAKMWDRSACRSGSGPPNAPSSPGSSRMGSVWLFPWKSSTDTRAPAACSVAAISVVCVEQAVASPSWQHALGLSCTRHVSLEARFLRCWANTSTKAHNCT